MCVKYQLEFMLAALQQKINIIGCIGHHVSYRQNGKRMLKKQY